MARRTIRVFIMSGRRAALSLLPRRSMRVQERRVVPTSLKERRAVLIVNPNAGRGRAAAARDVETFSRRASESGVGVRVEQTAGADDAARLARETVSAGASALGVRGGGG